MARFPECLHQLISRAPARRLVRRRYQHIGPDIDHIRPGKTDLQRRADDAVALLDLVGQLQQPGHRLALCRLAVVGGIHHGYARMNEFRARRTVEYVLHQPRHVQRPLTLVHVRIGAVAHHQISRRYHLRRHVGVHVQRRRHQNVRSCQRTHLTQQIALRIKAGLGHHRAMQHQDDRIELLACPQRRRDQLFHPRPVSRCHRPGRAGGSSQWQRQFPAIAVCSLDETADLGVGVRQYRCRLQPLMPVARLEIRLRGGDAVERVRLVHDLRKQHALHFTAPSQAFTRAARSRQPIRRSGASPPANLSVPRASVTPPSAS